MSIRSIVEDSGHRRCTYKRDRLIVGDLEGQRITTPSPISIMLFVVSCAKQGSSVFFILVSLRYRFKCISFRLISHFAAGCTPSSDEGEGRPKKNKIKKINRKKLHILKYKEIELKEKRVHRHVEERTREGERERLWLFVMPRHGRGQYIPSLSFLLTSSCWPPSFHNRFTEGPPPFQFRPNRQ